MIDRACISLGERCNLKCSYCHFKSRLSGHPQEFSAKDLITIIDNISSYCTSNHIQNFKIGIVGSGEPLLEYNKIKELINHIQQKPKSPLTFYTITNGTLINEKIVSFFYHNRDLITLCFSLDGYEELHNIGRQNYQATYDGISQYEAIFARKPPINCTVHKETILNAKLVRKFFADEDFNNVTFSRLEDSTQSNLTISNSEYSKFIEECEGFPFSVRQLKPENSKKYDCTMYGKLCGVGRSNIFITKLGIYPCGRFYGNSRYNYGPYNADLHKIDKELLKMRKLTAGECYYNKYVRSHS